MALRGGLLVLIVCLGGFLAGHGVAGSKESDDEQAVLRVVKKGRVAILRDRPRTVCRLLTRRARRNSLRSAEFDEDQSDRPRPRSCVDAIGRMIDRERENGGLKILRRPSYRKFTVERIAGNRAHVTLGTHTDIYLLRRRDGWRGDFGNFSPFDGSSGR